MSKKVKFLENYKKIFLIFLMISFYGCATKFSCGQFPDAECNPVSSTYDETNSGYNDYRKDLFKDDKKDKKNKIKELEKEYKKVGRNKLDYADYGDPILTKPVYMRWLFNDWVDKNKNLHQGGYFYVKVKDSEWLTQ